MSLTYYCYIQVTDPSIRFSKKYTPYPEGVSRILKNSSNHLDKDVFAVFFATLETSFWLTGCMNGMKITKATLLMVLSWCVSVTVVVLQMFLSLWCAWEKKPFRRSHQSITWYDIYSDTTFTHFISRQYIPVKMSHSPPDFINSIFQQTPTFSLEHVKCNQLPKTSMTLSKSANLTLHLIKNVSLDVLQ